MHQHEQTPPSRGRSNRIVGDAGNEAATVALAAAAARAGRPVPPNVVPLLQRTAGNSAVASILDDGVDGSLVHSVVGQNGTGQPLSPPVQALMESHLGVDLSDVRVHTDSRASESAAAINASAYTSGNHIVFQRQAFEPGTDSGLRMLAHELTHVVQQRRGPVDGSPVAGGVNLSDPSDRFEQAAERKADSIVRAISGAGGAQTLQRLEGDELA